MTLRRSRLTLVGAMAVAVVLTLAACSSSSPSSSSTYSYSTPSTMAHSPKAVTSGPVTVVAGAGGQMIFAPSTFSVKHGQSITVKNAGTTQHTFTVTGQSIDVTIQPGQSQQIKIDLTPGTYPFICRLHQSLGMTGTMTVT